MSSFDFSDIIREWGGINDKLSEIAGKAIQENRHLKEENQALKAELEETKEVLRRMCERFDPYLNNKLGS